MKITKLIHVRREIDSNALHNYSLDERRASIRERLLEANQPVLDALKGWPVDVNYLETLGIIIVQAEQSQWDEILAHDALKNAVVEDNEVVGMVKPVGGDAF